MADKATTDQKVQSLDEMFAPDVMEYKLVPGFKDGTFICIGSVTAGDMIDWSEASEGEAKKTAGLRLIIKSVCDGRPEDGATGKRIMNDSHLPILRGKKHKTTEAIVKEILKLNGMTVKQDAAAKND